MQNRRSFVTTMVGAAAALTASGTIASSAVAAPAGSAGSGGSGRFPDTIPLPVGFFPEGIAIGNGPHAYVSSLANGDVYKLNLVTGAGRIITPGPGTGAAGIALDAVGRLFVAGGGAGSVWVIDSASGRIIKRYQLAEGTSFVNDFVLTRDAVWVTDSTAPVLYKLPLGRRGALPAHADVVRVPLGGDVVFQEGWNANGIVRTPDREALLVVQLNTGQLFRVDPATGVGTEVDLGGEKLVGGDGMLLEGNTLYVVLDLTHEVAVVRLNASGTVGRVIERRTDPRFDSPTTIARFGDRFYLPNARFGIPSPQTAEYTVVAIPR
jgi:sugar lactone lactonase YvrE